MRDEALSVPSLFRLSGRQAGRQASERQVGTSSDLAAIKKACDLLVFTHTYKPSRRAVRRGALGFGALFEVKLILQSELVVIVLFLCLETWMVW